MAHRIVQLTAGLVILLGLTNPAHGEYLNGRHGKIFYDWSPAQSTCPHSHATVLVHGFSTPSWAWTPLFEALQNRGCAVLRFDLHGRGQSASARIDTLETFHDQIDDLRHHLKLDAPIDLVGWSMGGAIVASYIEKRGESVGKAVFIAPFSQSKSIPLIQWPVWDWVVVEGLAQFELPWSYRHNFADPDLFEQAMPHYAQLFQDVVLNPDMAKSLLSSAREVISQNQMSHYKAIGQTERPVLMIWGKEDEVLDFQEHIALLEAMPQTQFVAIDQCGHVPQLEKPEVVLPAVFDFLLGR